MGTTIDITDINKFASRFDSLIDTSIQFGIKLVIAVIILIIGLWVAQKLTNSLRKLMILKDIEPSLCSFLSSLSSIVLKILVIIIVLTTVGIEMTSIVAILGAASLAVGMALSGTLQNFAGGVVILLFKPFKVGDFIETQNGFSGTVTDIFIFTTRIKTIENKMIYMPNGALSNGVITNSNQAGTRRTDCTYGIAYGNDVEKARSILLDMLTNDERVHKDPAPVVLLSDLAPNSVNITVRYWADTSDALNVKFELNEKVYAEFRKQGFSFPFPQMDVHIQK